MLKLSSHLSFKIDKKNESEIFEISAYLKALLSLAAMLNFGIKQKLGKMLTTHETILPSLVPIRTVLVRNRLKCLS